MNTNPNISFDEKNKKKKRPRGLTVESEVSTSEIISEKGIIKIII